MAFLFVTNLKIKKQNKQQQQQNTNVCWRRDVLIDLNHVVSFMKKMIIFWTGSQIKRINKAENSNPDENTCNSNGNIYGHILKKKF